MSGKSYLQGGKCFAARRQQACVWWDPQHILAGIQGIVLEMLLGALWEANAALGMGERLH